MLKRRNIHTAADLVQYTEEDLRKFIGRNSLEEIKKKMAMFGLEQIIQRVIQILRAHVVTFLYRTYNETATPPRS